jgi:hypothetical protein
MAKKAGAGKRPSGAALLKAVERIVEAPAQIRAKVAAAERRARGALPDDATEAQVRASLERALISQYSNKTALAGGAAALPSILPGVGTLASALGGGVLDMTLCLKFEIEMVLALTSSRGYDIEDPRERQLAYLLAAAHTYEASGGRTGALADLVKTEADAIWHYTPRQLGKLVSAAFVKLALQLAGRGLARAIPLVGVVVSTAANKTLTGRVGRAVVRALDERESRRSKKAAAPAAGKRRAGARRSAAGRRGREARR